MYVIETGKALYGPFIDAAAAVGWSEVNLMGGWVLRPLTSAAQNDLRQYEDDEDEEFPDAD